MRVLLISNRYPTGADDDASPFVPHFVNALERRGVTVDVLTPRYGAVVPGEPDNVHRFATGSKTPVGSWRWANPISVLRLALFILRARASGSRLCRTHKYDHIFALWALPSGEFARGLSRKFDIAYSVWCLGSDINVWSRKRIVGRRIERILQGAACVFADGEELCERVVAQFAVPCTYLPSFRPLPPVPTNASLHVGDATQFLYLGRIHRDKGVFELLRAFDLVRQSLPEATLRFVGDGPAIAELKSMIGLRFVSGAVRCDGRISATDVTAAYIGCNCVVIPTRSDSLPLVFSEAVQMSVPVIGTDVGDLGRLIRRYHVGMVTRSTDPRDLAATMIRMARSPVFDAAGREEMLAMLDPNRAAEMFCRRALGVIEWREATSSRRSRNFVPQSSD